MKDYSLIFILIDDLIEDVKEIEENLIISHKIK